jgi:hypothetical protein
LIWRSDERAGFAGRSRFSGLFCFLSPRRANRIDSSRPRVKDHRAANKRTSST